MVEKNLYNMFADGEYLYSMYCEEKELEGAKRAYLICAAPLNVPVTIDITFQKVSPDDYEVYQEDSDRL